MLLLCNFRCIFLLTYNNLLTCNNYQLPLLITIRTYTQKWVDVSPVQLLGEVSQTFAFFEIFLPCLHFYYTTKLLFVSILLTTYPHLSSNVICESSLSGYLVPLTYCLITHWNQKSLHSAFSFFFLLSTKLIKDSRIITGGRP